jgi:hypothetical protein
MKRFSQGNLFLVLVGGEWRWWGEGRLVEVLVRLGVRARKFLKLVVSFW